MRLFLALVPRILAAAMVLVCSLAACSAPRDDFRRAAPQDRMGSNDQDPELATWDSWWKHNQHRYLAVRAAVRKAVAASDSHEGSFANFLHSNEENSLRPRDEDILDDVLPALEHVLDTAEDTDLESTCLIAMAKIGRSPSSFRLRDVFLGQLASGSPRVQETAALCIGIAGLSDNDSCKALVSLALDDEAGRRLADRASVPQRTRAFACYGLGLLARVNPDPGAKRMAFDALRTVLGEGSGTSRDLQVAAIDAIGLLGISSPKDERQPTTPLDGEARALLGSALECLEDAFVRDREEDAELLPAHAATAIARLLRDHVADTKRIEKFQWLFANELAGEGPRKRSGKEVARSCALSLGTLCLSIEDETSRDFAFGRRLLDTWKSHRDPQTRYFSILALGRIGGSWCRHQLLQEFDTADKSLERPWVAMAMGVYSFQKYEAQKAAGQSIAIEIELGSRIRDAFLHDREDSLALAGLAVSLGLIRYREGSADDLRQLLSEKPHSDVLAGHLCIALACMDDLRSVDSIRDIASRAVGRPELLHHASVALAMMGDKPAADELHKLVADRGAGEERSWAVARVLASIGDRRTLHPLTYRAKDERMTPRLRALAVAALGDICDRRDLSWNHEICGGFDGRASAPWPSNGLDAIPGLR